MNIFRREMKASQWALIIWSISIALLVISGMAKYTAYAGGGAAADIFDDIPQTLKALLGFSSFDVTTPMGFYAMLFGYLELTTAIHAVLLGAGIISKEENDKTSEFLMVKPVSRSAILTAKLSAALINVVVVNIVSLISSIVLVTAYTKAPDISGKIAVFMFSMFIVQLIFLALGATVAAVLKDTRSAGAIANGVLLTGFMISKITDLTPTLGFLNLLAPFTYFDLGNLVNGSINMVYVLLSLALVAVFTAIVYGSYNRRDLRV